MDGTTDQPTVQAEARAFELGSPSTHPGVVDPREVLEGLDAREHPARARRALEGLGAAYRLLGRYLATRPDLVEPALRRELAEIHDEHAGYGLGELDAICRADLGQGLDDVFVEFDPLALETGILAERHRAVLPGGRPIIVKFARHEVGEQVERDAAGLALAIAALVIPELDQGMRAAAAREFSSAVALALDTEAEARALAVIANGARGVSVVAVASVVPELCARRLLAIERPEGATLEHWIHVRVDDGQRGAPRKQDLLRRAFGLWLWLALDGLPFPVEPRLADFVVLPDGRVALLGGAFRTLAGEARKSLWQYLGGAATRDPERMHAALMHQLARRRGRGNGLELMQRFKEYAPFRDSGGAHADGLSEELVHQWCIVARAGYAFHSDLIDFHRGLAVLATECDGAAPAEDTLLEALKDARMQALARDVRENVALEHVRKDWDKYALAFMGFAHSLDQLLSERSWGGSAPAAGERTAGSETGRATAALVLGLAALALSLGAESPAGGMGVGGSLTLVCGLVLVLTAIQSSWSES